MKSNILLIILFFTLFSSIIGQNIRPPVDTYERRERLDQLEKVKLLELLDLDDEKMLLFFKKYGYFKDKSQMLMMERDSIMRKAENLLVSKDEIKEAEYKRILENLIKLEEKIVTERTDFFKSLNSILSVKQIVQVIIFQSKFHREIQEIIMEKRFRKQPPPKQ